MSKDAGRRSANLDAMNESPLIDERPESACSPTGRDGCAPDARNKEIILDVRDDIRSGREPFSKIMATVSSLGSDQQLRLIAPFEPVPLFHVLAQQGFQHTAWAKVSGDWEVLFTRRSSDSHAPALRRSDWKEASAENRNDQKFLTSAVASIVEVDARGLEPPQPLVTILEALAALHANSEVHARTDRRPMHLYPQLEERGFAADTQEQSDGSFLTHIRRR